MAGRSDPRPAPILKKFLANVGIAGSNALVSGTLARTSSRRLYLSIGMSSLSGSRSFVARLPQDADRARPRRWPDRFRPLRRQARRSLRRVERADSRARHL